MTTDGDSHVLHWARAYDVLVGVLTLGREKQFRASIIDVGRLEPGEAVLDVGCGTGSLAIAAKGRVGGAGEVSGVDPSPEMVARARQKAARRNVDIRFEIASVESLPFADAAFDVVLGTLMLHHLTDDGRRTGIAEIVRVLKPGGRFLAVDIGGGGDGHAHVHGFLCRAGKHAHSDFDLDRLGPLLESAGLGIVERGPITQRLLGMSQLRYTVAATPPG